MYNVNIQGRDSYRLFTSVKQTEQSQQLLQCVLISLFVLAVLLLLFIFRQFDNNRLTSWFWVFADFSSVKFFIMISLGMIISYPLSRFSLPEKSSVFALTTFSFFITTVFWQQPEVIVDASRYFMQAKYVELYGPGFFIAEWGNVIPAWTDMPLVPFIYGVIFWVFGETRLGIQIFSSLLFAGTVTLTYLIGKTLWNRQLGLYAAALLLGIPYLLTQVPLFMVDIAAMFFLTLAIYSVINAIEKGNVVSCLWASVVITLALLVKYSNGLMLSIIPIIFLVNYQKGWRPIIRLGLIVAIGVFILFGIFLLIKFDVFIEQLQLLQSYQMPALSRWKESLSSTFLFQIHPVITITAVYSLYRVARKKEIKYLTICWLVILTLILDVRRIRYMIVIFPMLTLMSAYGLYYLKDEGLRRFVVSSTVLSSVLIAVFAYLPFLEKTSSINIKQAGEYLDLMGAEFDRVDVYVQNQSRSSVNPSVIIPILDLFTDKELVYHFSESVLNAPDNIDSLPLRWTWELDSSQYLRERPNKNIDGIAIVVIQSSADKQLPEFIRTKIKYYRLRKAFNVTDKAFKFQTTVKIYRPVSELNIEEKS